MFYLALLHGSHSDIAHLCPSRSRIPIDAMSRMSKT
jgi:hypothetical protein